MATTDYDAPRKTEADEESTDAFADLAVRRIDPTIAVLDVDEEDPEPFELPGADLSGEELTVRVLPIQADEFTCSSCYLVQHRHRLAARSDDRLICDDCA